MDLRRHQRLWVIPDKGLVMRLRINGSILVASLRRARPCPGLVFRLPICCHG